MSPLITLHFKEFRQIRIYHVISSSFVLVRNYSCVITSGRRDRIGEAPLIADLRRVRWRKVKDGDVETKLERWQRRAGKRQIGKKRNTWQLQPFNPFCQLEALRLCNICPPNSPSVGCQPRDCPSSHLEAIHRLTGMHKAKLQTQTPKKK